MSFLAVLLSIAWGWGLAVALPGPNFLMMVRVATLRGRMTALAACLGIGLGTAFWALAAFFGLRAAFAAVPWLYAAMKIGGGLYLILLGLRLAGGALRGESTAGSAPPRLRTGFWLGLLTSLSNPKSALLVASLFAAVMPQAAPLALGLAAVAVMVAVSIGWYAAVGALLSTGRAGAAFLRKKRLLDGVAGLTFIGYGARFVLAG